MLFRDGLLGRSVTVVLAASWLFSSATATPISSSSADIVEKRNADACTTIYEHYRQGNQHIEGEVAYNCLISVPFDSARSVYILQQMRLFSQIYSAQAFFKDPPTPELRIKPVDLNATFDEIEKKASAKDGYKNDYEFQTELSKLFESFHDGHVLYRPACSSEFVFYHNYPLVALVEDGKDHPRIYVADHDTGEIGKEVAEIDGEEVNAHLERLARELPELYWIDADARYNTLLMSKHPIEGLYRGVFALRKFWYGKSFKIKFTNGNEIDVEWTAFISREPVYTNSQEYIDKVCLDPNYEGIENKGNKHERRERTTQEFSRDIAAYERRLKTRSESWLDLEEHPPRPQGKEIYHTDDPQADGPDEGKPIEGLTTPIGIEDIEPATPWPELSLKMGGCQQTLHLLTDKIAVWGIHAFADLDGQETFFQHWQDFILEAFALLKEKGITHLLIDVSGNGGGYVSLGLETIRQFFPDSIPYYGFDLRRSPALDLLVELGAESDASHLNLNDLKDINNNDFSDYKAFLGPVYKYGDYFTSMARWDVNDSIADIQLPPPDHTTPPFAPDNIVLISDGRCGSTCAIFGEAITNVGVRSIAINGIGSDKAGEKQMQHVGGIKGSQVWSWDAFMTAHVEEFIPNPEQYPFLPKRLPVNHISSMNLRNSYEVGSDLPLEFTFQPANLHFYHTKEMWDDKAALWKKCAELAWDGSGKNILPDVTYTPGGGGKNSTEKGGINGGKGGPKGGEDESTLDNQLDFLKNSTDVWSYYIRLEFGLIDDSKYDPEAKDDGDKPTRRL